MSAVGDYENVHIAESIVDSDLLQSTPPPRSLRVCCYGSSSSLTPEAYLQEARHVGYLLAKRGHVTVNGAGSYGCMAAMNDGACKGKPQHLCLLLYASIPVLTFGISGNGHIVGVIHEMWLTNGEDSNKATWTNGVPVRDGGAHGAFAADKTNTGAAPDAPIRQMLVAGGTDLQERKRLLMEGADALLVLPGGPGTWDELWEAACARGIGLSTIPIVVVNKDGFYDPFLRIMERAYQEDLTKLQPDELIRFESNAEGAVRWIESLHGQHDTRLHSEPQKSREFIRKSSMMTIPPLGRSDSWFFGLLQRKSFSQSSTSDESHALKHGDDGNVDSAIIIGFLGAFVLGVSAGIVGYSWLTKTSRK